MKRFLLLLFLPMLAESRLVPQPKGFGFSDAAPYAAISPAAPLQLLLHPHPSLGFSKKNYICSPNAQVHCAGRGFESRSRLSGRIGTSKAKQN